MRHSVNNWSNFIQALLAPAVCTLCGAPGVPQSAADICRGCLRDLPRIRRGCRACGLPLAAGEVCGACLRRPPAWDTVVVPFAYAFPVAALLKRLKYEGALPVGRLLGVLLAGAVRRRRMRPDVVVPVPLHGRREARRGGNQALEIAAPAARRLGLPLDRRLVRRPLATRALWGMSPRERRSALAGAFECSYGSPDHVAIVDDILTTGATVGAVTAALRAAGARRVDVWAVARTLSPPG